MTALQNWTVRVRLLGAFAITVLITLAMGLMGTYTITQLSAATEDMYANNLNPIKDVSNANMQAIYMHRDLYDYLIEDQKPGMDKIRLAMDAHYKTYNQLIDSYVATYLTPPEKELLEKVKAAWPPYLAAADKVMQLSYADQNKEAYAVLNTQAKASFQTLDDRLSELVNLNVSIAETNKNKAEAAASNSRFFTLGAMAMAVVASLVLALAITASITGPLQAGIAFSHALSDGDLTPTLDVQGKDEMARLMQALMAMKDNLVKVVGSVRQGSENVATASAEIAQGNNDLSSRTEEQASALEQTAASMEQLGATVKQNADSARQANVLAASASTVAVKGGEVVSQVVETMKGINESSRRISDIISVIDGIAFQTNILALNAAVEAARAGDQGRGFAVVASEVRTLAGRSAEAAKEIKSLINASVERVEQGTTLVDQAGETMTEVVSSIRRVNDIVGEISAASAEQAAGVSQINEAVVQMDTTTQQNAALVEQMAAAASSLKVQAGELVQTVSVFKLSTHGALPRMQVRSATRSAAFKGPERRLGEGAQAAPKKPAQKPMHKPTHKPAAQAEAADSNAGWEAF